MNKNIHMAKTLSSQTLKKNDNAPPLAVTLFILMMVVSLC